MLRHRMLTLHSLLSTPLSISFVGNHRHPTIITTLFVLMNDFQIQLKEIANIAHSNQPAFFARFFPHVNMTPPFTEELINFHSGHKTCIAETRMIALPETTWIKTKIDTDEYLKWVDEIKLSNTC